MASATAGWPFTTPSTSSGYTFSPPVLIETAPRPSSTGVTVPLPRSRIDVDDGTKVHGDLNPTFTAAARTSGSGPTSETMIVIASGQVFHSVDFNAVGGLRFASMRLKKANPV